MNTHFLKNIDENILLDKMYFLLKLYFSIMVSFDEKNIASSDYIDYLDTGANPPENSQYWVAPIYENFIKSEFSEEEIDKMKKKHLYVYMRYYMKKKEREYEKKAIEEKVVKTYYEQIYNFSPDFNKIKNDIPDCYFDYNGSKFAVEVTRYYSQTAIKENIEYSNSVNRFIDAKKLIKNCYNRLGKGKVINDLFIFKSLKDLCEEVILGATYINNITVRSESLYLLEKSAIDKTKKIIDFLDKIKNEINDGYEVRILLNKKNKHAVLVRFKYSKILSFSKTRSILPIFSFWENIDEVHNNILASIEKKIDKFEKEYKSKIKKYNLYYDYYILVVYYEMIPGEVDDELLYNLFKEKFKEINYSEIAIFVLGGIMIINKNGYIFHKY